MYQLPVNAIFRTGIAIILLCAAWQADAQNKRDHSPRHGQARQHDNGFVVWDNRANSWVSPRRFWANYARRKGSRYWGQSKFYPPYANTRAHDLVTITTSDGACLMEFYHGRWRRANDVWRWNRRFNNYAGCASVHRHRRSLFKVK